MFSFAFPDIIFSIADNWYAFVCFDMISHTCAITEDGFVGDGGKLVEIDGFCAKPSLASQKMAFLRFGLI